MKGQELGEACPGCEDLGITVQGPTAQEVMSREAKDFSVDFQRDLGLSDFETCVQMKQQTVFSYSSPPIAKTVRGNPA